MSADNILCIVSYRGKVRVYDVGFSGLTGDELWGRYCDGDHTAVKDVIDGIVSHGWELWTGYSAATAENFCRNHMREHVVEYDYTFIGIDRKFEIKGK